MQIRRAGLSDCENARGVVVAIDVLRAFTTAAYAFSMGVSEIVVTSEVEEAFLLRKRFPDAMLLGEINGIQVAGFDLGNSPSRLDQVDLRGKRLIMRTTAGTQGLVRSRNARRRLATALCNATASADFLSRHGETEITLVQTGVFPDGWGDEDAACADWIEARLTGQPGDLANIQNRVRNSRSGLHYDGSRVDFPPQDLELAVAIDCFDFVMEAFQEQDLIVLHKI